MIRYGVRHCKMDVLVVRSLRADCIGDATEGRGPMCLDPSLHRKDDRMRDYMELTLGPKFLDQVINGDQEVFHMKGSSAVQDSIYSYGQVFVGIAASANGG